MNRNRRRSLRQPAPAPREARDRAAHQRKLTLLKRLSLAAAVLAFGGGWTLVGHHAVGVTSQSGGGASAGTGITTAVPSTDGSTVPGLGRPDAQGFFTYQPGLRQSAAASARTTTRVRPSIRSRGS